MDAPTPKPAPGLQLDQVARDCILRILDMLPFIETFRVARVSRSFLSVLLSRPIKGLPVLEVASVTPRTRDGTSVHDYVIRYVGTPAFDVLQCGAAKQSESLIARFQTTFLLVFTFDSGFLSAWTAAHAEARIRAHAARNPAKVGPAPLPPGEQDEAARANAAEEGLLGVLRWARSLAPPSLRDSETERPGADGTALANAAEEGLPEVLRWARAQGPRDSETKGPEADEDSDSAA